MPADRFEQVAAALGELDFHVVTRGRVEPLAQAGDLIETTHQTWGLDRAKNVWRVDLFREPLCRRRVGRAVEMHRFVSPTPS